MWNYWLDWWWWEAVLNVWRGDGVDSWEGDFGCGVEYWRYWHRCGVRYGVAEAGVWGDDSWFGGDDRDGAEE